MPVVAKARTESLAVELFWHATGDSHTALEFWEHPCIAFTTHGAWDVYSSCGSATLTSDTLLVSAACTEYGFRHPLGLDDRVLAVTYRDDIDSCASRSVPVGARIHRLRRMLMREIAREHPEPQVIDDLGSALLAVLEAGDEPATRIAPSTRRVVTDLRDLAAASFPDPEFDFVYAAERENLTRTRFVHAFRDAFGVTPHQFLIACRVTHAARLLRLEAVSVIEACFASGFGSLSRFHAAFSSAFGMSPQAYRRLASGRA
jgi:AraC family transcriptional regulator